jgi:hypothetical protein
MTSSSGSRSSLFASTAARERVDNTRLSSLRSRSRGFRASAAAPVTGAAADEHKLNVVDCDASVTVPHLVLKWGSGGYPQSPEANVKDNGFPWPPPGLCVCVYYCRTFYKAVRVGEEESGGHVL